jgi:hypothetical protein
MPEISPLRFHLAVFGVIMHNLYTRSRVYKFIFFKIHLSRTRLPLFFRASI